MAQTVVIVGGMDDDPQRDPLIVALTARTGQAVRWIWVAASSQTGFRPDEREFGRILHAIREWKSERTRPKPKVQDRTTESDPRQGLIPSSDDLRVVKLWKLNGQSQSKLYGAWAEPVLVPKEIETSAALVEWLLSPDAALVPPTQWMANIEETALVSLLSKLLRNKSWNKDVQGHQWTQEADLLGQSPVARSDIPTVRVAATRLLQRLEGTLFLTKGGDHGKTKKEWCINTTCLPHVKRAILKHSLSELVDIEEITGVLEGVFESDDRAIRLDGDAVTERVRQVCREPDRTRTGQ
jgi:hypothetical protein